jgi:hypothetical protein
MPKEKDEELAKSLKEYLWISSEGWHESRHLAMDVQKGMSLTFAAVELVRERLKVLSEEREANSELLDELNELIDKVKEQQRLTYKALLEMNKARIESEKVLAQRIIRLDNAMERLLVDKYGGKNSNNHWTQKSSSKKS